MPVDGFTLEEFPLTMIEIACGKCGRHGWLRKDWLVAKYGAEIKLPDLLMRIADCELSGSMHDPCALYYVALKPVG